MFGRKQTVLFVVTCHLLMTSVFYIKPQVVSGIIASPFPFYHEVPHAGFAILRMWYWVSPSVMESSWMKICMAIVQLIFSKVAPFTHRLSGFLLRHAQLFSSAGIGGSYGL